MQQFADVVQFWPGAWQVVVTAHAPLVQESPGQQLLLAVQLNPVPRQVGGLMHEPLLQERPEQHGAVASQP